jgi:RsiW-degrading membrane proteinase PrsW (M82 family)
MNYLLLILFGFLPSIIWLLFYLRKDAHPEPKTMVLKVFFFGMLIAFPAAFIEIMLFKGLGLLHFSPLLIAGLNMFVAVAFVEEFMKYAVIKQKVIRNKEFDEPVDAMIYMIIVALGFAAVENLLILFPLSEFFEIFTISGIRFVGATFLHALCSAMVGYFIALWFFRKKSFGLVIFGLLMAVMCHGLYNFSIMVIDNGFKFVVPGLILVCLAFFVSWAFLDLKKN